MEEKRAADEKNTVIVRARWLRWLHVKVAVALGALFGWLQLNGEVGGWLKTVSDLPSLIVLKCSLVVYFLSWTLGPQSDLDALELALPSSPLVSRWSDAIPIVLLFLGFGGLCWAVESRHLIEVLGIFWTIDFLSVRLWLKRNVENSATCALERAAGDVAKSASIRAVVDQSVGQWRWRRYYAGYGLIVVMAIVNFSRIGSLLGRKLNIHRDLVFACTFLLFVLVVECWMWQKRIGRAAILDAMRGGILGA